MSGARWTTGLGIAVGGIGGAIVALLGAATNTRAPAPSLADASRVAEPASAASLPARSVVHEAPSAMVEESPVATASVSATTVTAEPSAAPSAAAPIPSFGAAPPRSLPSTLEALLTAEMYCDKRQDFDECERAAAALEAGTAGPSDAKQAKRFRRIALTHLVNQCEAGSPHACFVMAGKFRAGTELTVSPVRAEALEKRGLQLCRLGRHAPECPPP